MKNGFKRGMGFGKKGTGTQGECKISQGIEKKGPYKKRCIKHNPQHTFFKPAGISNDELEINILEADEFEALRLANIEGASQIEGAESMDVSSATFNRALKSAYKKIADSLINGKAIEIIKNEDNIEK